LLFTNLFKTTNITPKASWPPIDNWEYDYHQTLQIMDYYNKTPNKGHKGKANYSVDFHGNSINHSDKNSALSSKILSTPGKIVQNSSIHLWTNNSQFQMSTIKVKALPIPDIKFETDYGGDMY